MTPDFLTGIDQLKQMSALSDYDAGLFAALSEHQAAGVCPEAAQSQPAAAVPTLMAGVTVTEAMHVAACKVLLRAHGLDGLPQRMLDAMLAAAPQAPNGDALKDMEARKDAAYLERNQVVAALAKAYPSGVARTAIEGWSEDWHGCVYIDLPTGQASWHFHDSQAYLFADLQPYTGKWDGHDTPEKYRRLAALPAAPQRAEPWRPIETAPKDAVLLLAAEFDRPGDWRIKCGTWIPEEKEWRVWGASWIPTRWQPLPAPPTTPVA